MPEDGKAPPEDGKAPPEHFIHWGICIFIINIIIAWYVVRSTHKHITDDLMGEQGKPTVTAEALKNLEKLDPKNQGDMAKMVLLSRALQADVHVRNVSNKQTIVVVAFASAFGLMAIGFSLFVMGARGAIELSANGGTKDGGTLLLKSASPGLVCMVLATLIIIYSLKQNYQIHFNDSSVALGQPKNSVEPGADIDAPKKPEEKATPKPGEEIKPPKKK